MGNKGLKKSFMRNSWPTSDALALEAIEQILTRLPDEKKKDDGQKDSNLTPFVKCSLWQLEGLMAPASWQTKLTVLGKLQALEKNNPDLADTLNSYAVYKDIKDNMESLKIVQERLDRVLPRFAALHDPEYGDVGAMISDMLKRFPCNSYFSKSADNTGNYHPFECPGTVGATSYFTNHFTFGRKAIEKSEENFMIALAHELSHYLENNLNPVMHLSPYNKNSKITLSPKSWTRLVEYTERRAYTATQLWLPSLLNDAALDKESKNDPVSTEEFRDMRRKAGLKDALIAAGDITFGKNTNVTAGKDSSGNSIFMSYRDYYHKLALDDFYGRGNAGFSSSPYIRDIIDGKIMDVEFVELGDDDILSLGDYIMGPNIFGEGKLDERWKKPLVLSAENQKRLDELEGKLGIKGKELRTIDEALAARGITRAQFFDHSISGAYPGLFEPIIPSIEAPKAEIPSPFLELAA
jgi:hypothetical protein